MNRKIVSILLLLTVTALIVVPGGLGFGSYLNAFNAKYGTGGTNLDTCNTCHIAVPTQAGVPNLNPYGQAVSGEGDINQRLTNAETLDSDGDGYTNIAEINAQTFPGNANDIPEVTPTVTPVEVTPTVTPVEVTPTVTPVEVTPTVTPVEVTPTVTPVEVTPTVTVTPVEPIPVPEFPTVILPVAAVMGLMLLLLYRRRE